MANINVSVASDALFQVGPFTITNSIIATLTTSLIIIIVALFVRRGAGIVPSRPQVLFEAIYEFFYDKMVMTFGSPEKARKFFPLMFTIFLYLLVANQFTMIPFIQSIVTPDGVELFRTPTSDYSHPITLALLILILANGLAIMNSPLRYIGNFINFKGFRNMKSIKDLPFAFLDLFMGVMDIVGELAKLVSLATRLFGNIFAGEVLVTVIVGLAAWTKYFFAIPFLGLSLLSGFVQAFVFAILGVIAISSSLDAVKKPN